MYFSLFEGELGSGWLLISVSITVTVTSSLASPGVGIARFTITITTVKVAIVGSVVVSLVHICLEILIFEIGSIILKFDRLVCICICI